MRTAFFLKLCNSAKIPPVAVMVVIVWLLHLQLHVQSVPITTKGVSSNPVHGEMY